MKQMCKILEPYKCIRPRLHIERNEVYIFEIICKWHDDWLTASRKKIDRTGDDSDCDQE